MPGGCSSFSASGYPDVCVANEIQQGQLLNERRVLNVHPNEAEERSRKSAPALQATSPGQPMSPPLNQTLP